MYKLKHDLHVLTVHKPAVNEKLCSNHRNKDKGVQNADLLKVECQDRQVHRNHPNDRYVLVVQPFIHFRKKVLLEELPILGFLGSTASAERVNVLKHVAHHIAIL